LKKNLSKIKLFPVSEIKKLASKHLAVFKKRVTRDGLDYKGSRLPVYSEGYKEALQRDMRIKRGKRQGQRHKGLQGIALTTSGQKIGKRQFTLRGLTMSNFSACGAKTNEYILRWDGEAAAIVDWNASKGRNIVDDIPFKEWEFVLNSLGISYDKQMAKIKNIVVKVG